MKTIYSFISLISFFISINCGRESPTMLDPENEDPIFTEIQGVISENLTINKSPYLIIGNILIDSVQTISIEAGVQLVFSEGKSFYVYGNLFAIGSKENPIKFSAYKDSTWKGILISKSNDTEFKFCIFENIDSEDELIQTGSLRIENSNIKINNSIFRNNSSKDGGAVHAIGSVCIFTNDIFVNNFSEVAGGAIFSETSVVEIINNTFYKNNSFNFGGGIVSFYNERNFIQNNIFYKNTSGTGDPRIEIFPEGSGIIDTSYNFKAFGNLDPEFISENDFHLKEGSPCRNNGNPDEIYNDYNGSRNDQGAYGGPLGNW